MPAQLLHPCGRQEATFSAKSLILPNRSKRTVAAHDVLFLNIALTTFPGWFNFYFIRGPLAQLVEQLTLNQRVGGSSPPRLTRIFGEWRQVQRPAAF